MKSARVNANRGLTNKMLISYDGSCLNDDEHAAMGVNSVGR
jgi:hypothetical protein